MGVCCIVFDIDGMLFEFFMIFLNIEKNKILRFFFSIFQVFFAFHAISNIKKKLKWCKKKNSGGGVWFFFLEKQFFLISRFMLFSTFTQGAKPNFFGKPDMACCKRLCDKNIIHGPSGVN